MFFISGSLKKQGILNNLPDLQNLNDGDLKFNVDFRDIYATILKNWLGTAISPILGKECNPYNFV